MINLPSEWHSDEEADREVRKHAEDFRVVMEGIGTEVEDMDGTAYEYALRMTIKNLGRHPNGLCPNEWDEIYGD